MSSESIASKPFNFFDVPEIIDLQATFQYNFFMADETVDESGNDACNGNLSRRFLRKGTADMGNLNARTPRYVKLDFQVQDSKKSMMATRSSAAQGQRTSPRALKKMLQAGQVFSETQASGKEHDSYLFSNSELPTQLENMWINRFTALGVEEASRLEMLTTIAEKSGISNSLLEDMLPTKINTGQEIEGIDPDWLYDESIVWGAGALNTSYAPMILRAHVDRGNDLQYGESVTKYSNSIDNFEVDERGHVSNAEYVFDVPFTKLEDAGDTNFVGEADIIGYVFEKWREWGGKRYRMPAVVVVGQNLRNAFDSQVAYGQTYLYSARTVAKFRVPFTDYKSGNTYIGTFFLASRPTNLVKKTCLEERAPTWPPDINFYYDHTNANLRLTWSPPVNTQRDIKYLQIFRRSTVQEPFTLLVHYDFNDSTIVQLPKEVIETTLIVDRGVSKPTGQQGMPTTWVDTEFTKESTFIYAICVIDARQLSSAYSPQTQVSYDLTKNKIRKDLISYGGAPKQYPNWFLKENFFADAIKDSMHKKCDVYFNPECYKIRQTSSSKTGAGGTAGSSVTRVVTMTNQDPLARYVFQFMNVDRLLDQKLTVKINGKRLTEETTTADDSAAILSSAIDLSGKIKG